MRLELIIKPSSDWSHSNYTVNIIHALSGYCYETITLSAMSVAEIKEHLSQWIEDWNENNPVFEPTLNAQDLEPGTVLIDTDSATYTVSSNGEKEIKLEPHHTSLVATWLTPDTLKQIELGFVKIKSIASNLNMVRVSVTKYGERYEVEVMHVNDCKLELKGLYPINKACELSKLDAELLERLHESR